MKKVLLFFGWMLLIASIANAQVPQGIPYQAIARNGQGQPLANTNVKVRFSILDSTATGIAVYVESHNTTTSALGLFTANVGMGNPSTGTFSAINWGQNYKFLKVELDTTATGNSYIDLGTQQMMSVPYALYAGNVSVGNGLRFGYANNINWTCPSGVYVINIELWGGGGKDGLSSYCFGYCNNSSNSSGNGGLGGSGGYLKGSISVVPGQVYSIIIGDVNTGNTNTYFGTYYAQGGGNGGNAGCIPGGCAFSGSAGINGSVVGYTNQTITLPSYIPSSYINNVYPGCCAPRYQKGFAIIQY
jgi:hypothetical protein